MIVRGRVIRQRSTVNGTPGAMAFDNAFSCDTLELGWHGNERGRSCTMADTYRGMVWYSPSLKRLVIRFEDKNGRKDCLVHNGNWAGDEDRGQKTQVHGCTEVGHGYGEIQRPDGRNQWGILHSGATLAGLIDSLRCQPELADTVIDGQGFHDVQIAYQWAYGCAPEGQA